MNKKDNFEYAIIGIIEYDDNRPNAEIIGFFRTLKEAKANINDTLKHANGMYWDTLNDPVSKDTPRYRATRIIKLQTKVKL